MASVRIFFDLTSQSQSINHLICNCAISLGDLSSFVWGFVVLKWKYIFVNEQSKYGLFVVLWINSKPDLKWYTGELWWGGGGWSGFRCPFTCWWERKVGKGHVNLPLCPHLFYLLSSSIRPSEVNIRPLYNTSNSWAVCAPFRWRVRRSWNRDRVRAAGWVGGASSGLGAACPVCLAWRLSVLSPGNRDLPQTPAHLATTLLE